LNLEFKLRQLHQAALIAENSSDRVPSDEIVPSPAVSTPSGSTPAGTPSQSLFDSQNSTQSEEFPTPESSVIAEPRKKKVCSLGSISDGNIDH